MNPKRRVNRPNGPLRATYSALSSGSANGARSVSIVRMMLCSCRTRLCFKSCSDAEGMPPGSGLRKKVMPGTTWTELRAIDRTKLASGTSCLCALARMLCVPRHRFHIAVPRTLTIDSGTRPPSKTFVRFAARKTVSSARIGPTRIRARGLGTIRARIRYRHVSAVVSSIVPGTAIPWVGDSACDVSKPVTDHSTPNNKSQLIAPI